MSDNPPQTDQPDPDSIRRTLTRMLNGLCEVKVVTIVDETTVTVTSGENNRTITEFTQPAQTTQALVTIFNLVDGDATNIIGPKLKDDIELREYHSAQVEKSLKVLPQNVEAVITLARSLIESVEG